MWVVTLWGHFWKLEEQFRVPPSAVQADNEGPDWGCRTLKAPLYGHCPPPCFCLVLCGMRAPPPSPA